ncbi:MAG TPA: hypothetical protein VIK33_03495 [Anaerolineae bacterium]
MHRPFLVTVLALAVLSLATFNLLARFLHAFQVADLMLEYNQQGPLIADMLTGAVWTIGFGAAAIGLYWLKRRAWKWTLAASVLYQINLWAVRLAFEKSSNEPLTRPADAAISILSILLVWGVLFLPPARQAFRKLGSTGFTGKSLTAKGAKSAKC